jgi:hypothetical protein
MRLAVLLCWVALTARADVTVRPSDCDAGGDCRSAIVTAVRACNATAPGQPGQPCSIVLAPGRYRVACPAFPQNGTNYGYVRTPGAVDLSHTRDITFGAASPDAPAMLDIDYAGNGCPAIGASDAANLTVQNVVIDTVRLPFTDGDIVSVSDDRLTVQLRMSEPARAEWNTTKYGFLRDMYTPHDSTHSLAGFTGTDEWDPATGVATLRYATPRTAALQAGRVHMKHFVNMQAWGVYGFRVSRGMTVRHTTLLSCAGMGYRCDFCDGDYTLESSALRPGVGRIMSSTADGVHLMHHRGRVTLRDTVVNGTGDDCFNSHANFIVLANISSDRLSATYIDETGPGWYPRAAAYLVGDRVRFYSRLSLQAIGGDSDSQPLHRLVEAAGGFGAGATLVFDHPIPAGVARYDMMISTERVAALDVDGCTFVHGGRGIVMSVAGGRIANSYFANGGRDNPAGTAEGSRNTNSILALNGGCGCFEDYTEGPFSRDVEIVNNTFDHIAPDVGGAGARKLDPTAIVQFAGCRPVGTCGSAPVPAKQPYPMPPCEPGASTQPPLQTHIGDDGPGRLVEPGQRLDQGQTIYSNITVHGNAFVMGAGSAAAFVDVGATDGVRVTGNRMVRAGTSSGDVTEALADVSVYSSRGFDAAAVRATNECVDGKQQPISCVVVQN